MLKVAELSFQLIDELRPLVEVIRRRDRSLADQLTRAASSVALNLAEGELSDAGKRYRRPSGFLRGHDAGTIARVRRADHDQHRLGSLP
jgi:hypothetical protein